jgi:hypothetical protein
LLFFSFLLTYPLNTHKISKADLQKEILMLRSQLSSLQPEAANVSPSNQHDEQEHTWSTDTTFQSDQQLISEIDKILHRPELNTSSSPVEYLPPTPSREIDGVCVEGFQIKDCFIL